MPTLLEKIQAGAEKRIVLICMTAMDGIVLLALMGILICVDIAKEWLIAKLGSGSLQTRITLGTVEILLDLFLVNEIFSWLWADWRCTFKGDCKPNEL